MGWRVGRALLLAALLAGCAENRLFQGAQSQPDFTMATPEPAMQPAPQVEPSLATPLPAATPPAGKYGVQIAARRSEAEARATIDDMRARFPALLAREWATINRVSLPQGEFFRVMVGPLGSAQQAKQLCDSLKAQGAECIIRGT
ncbi:MAG: SPOR domain-containing protein [Rhizobiales bacterium]|nr:SPOR domain-containing protein [Hyphomicrobiales bacterium]